MTDSAYQHEDRPPSHAPFAVLMLTASVGNRTKAEQRAATGPAKQIPMGRFANFALAVRPELWGDAMDWLLAEGGISDMYEVIGIDTPQGHTEGYKETALRFEEKPDVGPAPTFEADHASYVQWRDRAVAFLSKEMIARGFSFDTESVCQAAIDPKSELTGHMPQHAVLEAMMGDFARFYCSALDQAALRASVREAEGEGERAANAGAAEGPNGHGGSAARRAPRML